MSKCRMIDRIAYTKGEIKFLDDNPEKQPEQNQYGDICPECGQRTLHHTESCVTCHACGYSKCAITR